MLQTPLRFSQEAPHRRNSPIEAQMQICSQSLLIILQIIAHYINSLDHVLSKGCKERNVLFWLRRERHLLHYNSASSVLPSEVKKGKVIL